MKYLTMKTRLAQLGVALACAAVWAPLAPTQGTAAESMMKQGDVAAKEYMAAHALGLVQEMLPEMAAYLREVSDRESADQAAMRLMVDLHVIMGMGEYMDAMGADTEKLVAPEMMKLVAEVHQQEERLRRESHYGSVLMAYAWDEGYEENRPEPTAAEKAAASSLLDEMDARKVEDILATVKDVETADAAGRAIVEKIGLAYLLAKAGYVPEERRAMRLSDKEQAQLKKLEAAQYHGSLLLLLSARELRFCHRRQ